MTLETWQEKAQTERVQAASAMPQEWRLPESFLQKATQHAQKAILDIPRECRLLEEQDINTTENYDATALVLRGLPLASSRQPRW
ncbi:hypothetical protein ASPBRDRAFT_49618 [Aspergillus brasiliensis CBS 101740]|uniref:Uncharacterized protein n=1 Tax=Aspergillus brasiliensis (strain CBS 101740 / IMI 381727 / IBT 21946) TaxID=767769 RepID=A0A1L9U1W5_ASPBC|nr:hypothetical protein ASPBRDRAFT_49618 [Aspergillus brasiliensis CBS 101740]